jgi:hypothetical protein
MLCCQRTRTKSSELVSTILKINPALSQYSKGALTLSCSSAEAIIHWKGFDEEVEVSEDQCFVSNIPAGMYAVEITVADEVIQIDVEVDSIDLPVVTSYKIVHASTDNARDGHIKAHLENATEITRYLWTNGSITSIPELCDVRPGIYTATPINNDMTNQPFLHLCSPAHVTVRDANGMDGAEDDASDRV